GRDSSFGEDWVEGREGHRPAPATNSAATPMSSRRVSPELVRERVVSRVCRRSSVRRWRKRYRELQCFSSYLRRVGSVRFPYPVSFPARMQPTVHLFDASPFLFRSFFSLPKSIVDTNGKPANAVYGFASFVAK